MTEEMTHLVLEHLRHIRTKVDTIEERVGRVAVRLSAVEGHLGSVLMSEASQNAEIDRIDNRLDLSEN